ncbi:MULTISPECIES: ParM/StbA family protein [Aeromonas]|uniref:Plasmid segregation protein ParM n=1 Tax=Aeromonas salmonicida TaxID=645 RepID=A0AAX1PCG8_AERSA|nr:MULTISPECIES: ParM/StbA family protein [Aeromonas]MDU4190475.1 ParM/StbA family protein [Aeromonas sp.]RAI97806.1 plasmid segregation protein ParM [Aeromonas salmonicida]
MNQRDFILGLDIGYSNLKMAMGFRGEEVTTTVLPVGAGPLELMPQQLTGGAGSCIQVVIDDEKWVAGVEPDRLQGWDRELHGDYPATKPYKALFYAALLLSEQKEIDVLVTGLPVNQFMEPERREALKKRLEGEHQITPKRSVTVKSVVVVPQPAGAYMEIVNSTKDEDLLDVLHEGKTIVIDPGFFSVDWVALEGGEIRYHSSGTSLKAMSVLLKSINLLIQEDHGGSPGIEKIEKAIRSGKDEILLFGVKVGLKEYLDKASFGVAQNALTPMRTSMREDGMDADVVLLAGGGATAYQAAAKELFPRSRIVMAGAPLVANARGFWFCG